MKIIHENHVLGDYETDKKMQEILNETIKKENSLKILDTKELYNKRCDLRKAFYSIFACLNYE